MQLLAEAVLHGQAQPLRKNPQAGQAEAGAGDGHRGDDQAGEREQDAHQVHDGTDNAREQAYQGGQNHCICFG